MIEPDEINKFVDNEFPTVPVGRFECIETGEGMAVARWKHDSTQLRPGGLISGAAPPKA